MRRELLQVQRKTEALERARAELHHAIRAAHTAGSSLREIRDATGGRRSHETVRTVIRGGDNDGR